MIIVKKWAEKGKYSTHLNSKGNYEKSLNTVKFFFIINGAERIKTP